MPEITFLNQGYTLENIGKFNKTASTVVFKEIYRDFLRKNSTYGLIRLKSLFSSLNSLFPYLPKRDLTGPLYTPLRWM